MRVRIAFLVGVVLAGVSLMSWARLAVADDAMPPVKIAVCDTMRILRESMEGKDIIAKTKLDEETLSKQLNLKKGEIQTKQDELNLLKSTTDDYQKKVEDLTHAQADTQAWLQATQVIMARRQQQQEKAMFEKILTAVQKEATTDGITLVISNSHPDFPPDLEQPNANAFIQTILLHTTLYNDTKLDITQKVIFAMDQAYTKGP